MLCLKSSSLLSCAILLIFAADVVQSRYKYHPESRRDIATYKEVATWEDAKKLCESEGATLASPISEELLQYMRAIITVKNHTTPYFIGFKARNNTEFRSEEGVLLEDVAAAFDMVDQIDPQEGDCLCMDGHSIRVEPCWSRLPFMCYTKETSVNVTTTEIPSTTPKDEPLQCDREYKRYSTGCYKRNIAKVNWDTARQRCAAEGAHLVVINDSGEAKVVAGIMDNHDWTWVGLRDVKRVAGRWEGWTASGEPLDELYQVWEGAYSDNPCVYLTGDGLLNNWRCHDTLDFICEK